MSTQCTLYMLALKPHVRLTDFAILLQQSILRPYLEGRISGWAVSPTHLCAEAFASISTWDIALLLESNEELPKSILDAVAKSWNMQATFANRMLAELGSSNRKLLSPCQDMIPKLTLEWSEGERPPRSVISRSDAAPSIGEVRITPERASWMRAHDRGPEGEGPVTMLNLMAYVPIGGKVKMARYAAAFQPAFEARYGTAVKLFGSVTSYTSLESDIQAKGFVWEDCAMIHYPSIWHFGEMLASTKYEELEHQYKIGSMRDTCILCISETGLSHATE